MRLFPWTLLCDTQENIKQEYAQENIKHYYVMPRKTLNSSKNRAAIQNQCIYSLNNTMKASNLTITTLQTKQNLWRIPPVA